ncbi:MAG TPA: hypothetical protein VHZ55_19030, partial [Bryobacteraceae bacterium]|nr:hypothetical protein [Bryobacteraceae bacterium]
MSLRGSPRTGCAIWSYRKQEGDPALRVHPAGTDHEINSKTAHANDVIHATIATNVIANGYVMLSAETPVQLRGYFPDTALRVLKQGPAQNTAELCSTHWTIS